MTVRDVFLSGGDITAPISNSEVADFAAADHEFSNVTREIELYGGGSGGTVKVKFARDDHDQTFTLGANELRRRPWRISHVREADDDTGTAAVVGYW